MRCIWRTSPPPEPQWPYDAKVYLVRLGMEGLAPWTSSLEWRRVAGQGCRWAIGPENQHWITHWLDGVDEPDDANTDMAPPREPGEWQLLVIPEDYPGMHEQLLEVESRDRNGESYFSRRWWRCSDDGMWGFVEGDRAGVAMRWRPIE